LNKLAIKLVVGAVAVVAAVLIIRSFVSARDAEWQERVEREMVRADLALTAADSLTEEAASWEAIASGLAVEAATKDTVVIRMIEELPAPPPDCEPFTAPRDSVIAVMEERHEDISAAFASQREASALLRAAEAEAHRAADSLAAVLDSRPRPLSPLIPEIGVGVFAGLCTTGQPCAGIGVGVQWKVRLF
jgi:hypothetical protein